MSIDIKQFRAEYHKWLKQTPGIGGMWMIAGLIGGLPVFPLIMLYTPMNPFVFLGAASLLAFLGSQIAMRMIFVLLKVYGDKTVERVKYLGVKPRGFGWVSQPRAEVSFPQVISACFHAFHTATLPHHHTLNHPDI